MGVIHIYGRDWGDVDKLDGLNWEMVLGVFINTFSKSGHIQLTTDLITLVTDSGVCCPVIL